MAGNDWHNVTTEQALKGLDSSLDGITEKEAGSRLLEYGPNELKQEKKVRRLEILISQFKSLLIVILIAATIFSAIIGEIIDAVAILVIVILNGLFGYVQEYKAEKTIEALKKLTRPETVVIRGGKEMSISSNDLVPGDLVLLEQGSRVTADMRIVEAVDLKVDESAITGESVPVGKDVQKLGKVQLADRKNMAWAGTLVTYGRGKAVVCSTGMKTEIGRIAHIIEEGDEDATPLQKKLDTFSKHLGIIILVICALVIVIGIAREGPLAGMDLTQELIITMVITGIALAVAAIPEGLPAVVTITLALGLQRLAKHNALMRKLPAVETLGSTTVICSDKTGTLTRNEMTITDIWMPGRSITVDGGGYEPVGKFSVKKGKDKGQLDLMLKVGALCCNARLTKGNKGYEVIGDPTEGSIVVAAAKAGMTLEDLETSNPRLKEIPFSSERKLMTTVNRLGPKKSIVCVKGAPEKLTGLCTKAIDGKREVAFSSGMKKSVLAANQEMTSRALRVLGIAYKEVASSGSGDLEKGLTFLGLVGMIDPARDEVKHDIEVCKKAGIKVVMITGDHRNTAVAVAKSIGIMQSSSKALTGEELDKMSEQDLVRQADSVNVYARVNPEHKSKIIDALHKRGHIVAMTGDGVNDAPALKAADIGISMGIKGTDVSKEASDMILRDDNFSSIVHAISGGRGIYDNIKKFIQYLLSSNLGEVLILFLAILIGFTDPSTGVILLPLTAIQLLWINLLTDGLPALALGLDPPSPGIMDRLPRNPKEKILNRQMLTDMVLNGVLIALGTLFLFWYNLPTGAVNAVTIAFTSVVMFEMVRVHTVRMNYKVSILSNKKLLLAMATSICLQLVVIYIPVLQLIFGTTGISLIEWAEILAVSFAAMAVMWVKGKVTKATI